MWERLTRYTQFHGHKLSGLELGNWLAVARFVPMCSDIGLETQQSFIDAYTSDPYFRIIRPVAYQFSRPGDLFSFFFCSERHFIFCLSFLNLPFLSFSFFLFFYFIFIFFYSFFFS